MEVPKKKLKSGFEMPVFGIGTWQMGGRFEPDPSNDDSADVSAIQDAIRMGITHIDTAERYASGHAEEIVGQAIRGFDRKNLFVVSKVASYNLSYDNVIKSAKKSLERMKTEYLDLYLIHAPNPNIPIRETMRAMDHLVEQGMVKNIGVSNFSIQRLEEAQSYTKNKIVANQLHYNLIFREVEKKGLVDWCQKKDVMLVAWRPVQKGALTQSGIKILDRIAKKYSKTPAQVAINWLVSQPNVVTLSKMGSKEHIKENLGGLGWKMDKVDIEELRRDFPNQQDISEVPLID
jgi:diketogulonate reductase-like aldo/keto reductase